MVARYAWHPAVQAAVAAVVLAVGVVRVATFDPAPPAPDPNRLYAALAGARTVRTQVEVRAADGSHREVAEGTLDLAAQRARLTVEVDRFGGPYPEVWDRSFTYVRPAPGRWFRFTGGTGPASRGFYLLALLVDAPPLSYEGRTTVRDVRTVRWGTDLPNGRLKVYVGPEGLPRRVELHQGTVLRVDLYDFFLQGEIQVPARFTSVPDRETAFARAAA
ncbi:MAG TPA: hypothetical protein VNA20_02725 [Frankiaceae bacterium]|nr:hypothetical protein [Frankiaceae bacterium]